MGIPLILYMVLALNVDIGKSTSTVDIYDQIFSLKRGGIYDRGYDAEHRINAPEIKKHIHHISQRIAFWMFENNADKATISQEKFEEICENEIKEYGEKGEDIQGDTLIGNFFKLKHSEGKGTDELQFVHRSIYEYFVSVYFFESIHKLISKEEVAGKLGDLLKDGYLSKEILEFIKCKFDSLEGKYFIDINREVFDILLQDGMTYYLIKEQKEPLADIIVREMNIFSNMLEIIHLWHDKLEHIDKKIELYLQFNRYTEVNLGGVNLGGVNISRANLVRANLRGADLRGAYLIEAHLSGADLSEADLGEADLKGAELSGASLIRADLNRADLVNSDLIEAHLNGADLSEADLRKADLSGADLRGVNLRGTDLSETDLRGANLRGANLMETIFSEGQVNILHEKYDLSRSRVVLSKTNAIIEYQEYCMRKQ